MRFRVAVSTFAALTCLTTAGVAVTLVSADDAQDSSATHLAGSAWTVETSSDYGATWTSPLDKNGQGLFPVRVNLDALGRQNFYQPVTLRNTVDSVSRSEVEFETAQLLQGDPEAAKYLRIRMAYSPEGVCSDALFDENDPDVEPVVGNGEPGPFDAPATELPIELGAGTPSTAGKAETVCIEFGTKRAEEQTPGGELTLAWPISARAAAPSDDEDDDDDHDNLNDSPESSTIDPTSPVRKDEES